MIISEAVKRITVGNDRVAYMVSNGKPLYINADGLKPYLPVLKANRNGTGGVGIGGTVGYVEDLTGNGNVAVAVTAANAPLYNAGGGLYFDGIDHYLLVQPSPSLDFGGKTQITLEAWATSDVVGWKGVWSLISRYNQFILGPNGDEMSVLVMTTDPSVSWLPLNYSSIDWGQASDPTFDELQWHHYCGVMDTTAGYAKLYVDGDLRFSQVIPTSPIIGDDGPIHLGHREADASGINNLAGRLADLRIWDRARNQTEIRRDMNRRLLGHEVGLKAYWPF